MRKQQAILYTIILAALMLTVLVLTLVHPHSDPVAILLILATAAYLAGTVLVVILQLSSDSQTATKLMQAFALPSAAIAGLAIVIVLVLK